MSHCVGIYVFEDVEVLDFAGPYEVFMTAARLHSRANPAEPPCFEVFTIGRTLRSVRARGGLVVQPAWSFGSHPPIDILIIPGGVVTAELEMPEVLDWIAATARSAEITASVCTGAFLLAKAGLLDGKSATTHWEDIEDFKAMFPAVTVQSGRQWVDQGAVVTAAGISAGIDMSLHLVERLADRSLAQKTAGQMEFDWKKNS